jgi:hypothetical protein
MTSTSAQDSYTHKNQGILGKRLLQLLMANIIPCSMHCTMVITKKLFTLLALETRGNKEIEEEWEGLLSDECDIELPEGGKGETFIERWKRAQISRPQALRVLENHSFFIRSLLLRRPERHVRLGQISSIWRRYYELTSLLVQAKVSITENKW